MTILKARSMFAILAIVSMVLTVNPPSAMAHRLSVFAILEGDTVNGEAYFNDGTPAKGCPVFLKVNKDQTLVKGKTNEEGLFSLKVPSPMPNRFEVIVEGGAGHRGTTTIETSRKGNETVKDANAKTYKTEGISLQGVSEETIETAVRKVVREEIKPVIDELLKLNLELSKPGITEILGGIGYIVGLTGLALWIRGKKRHE